MQEINFYDLIKHYTRFWLFILIFTAIGLISGLVYNEFVQVPTYKSDSTLILVTNNQVSTATDPTVINNYIDLLKSRRVLQPVINSLKLNTTYEQLSSEVSTSNDKSTDVVKLAISTKNPQDSKNAVNATIASFKSEVARLYGHDNIEVVDSASIPTIPSNVHKSLQLVLSTVAGFIVAIIMVFFIYDYRQSNSYKIKKASINSNSSRSSHRVARKIKSIISKLKIRNDNKRVKRQLVRDQNGRFASSKKTSSKNKTQSNNRKKK